MKIRMLFIMSAAALILAAPSAFAYNFNVCNQSEVYKVFGVAVHTVGSVCHDRTPVAVGNGGPPLLDQTCVNASTNLGCLIDQVHFYTEEGRDFGWSFNGAGTPLLGENGGTWTLTATGKVCLEDDDTYFSCQPEY